MRIRLTPPKTTPAMPRLSAVLGAANFATWCVMDPEGIKGWAIKGCAGEMGAGGWDSVDWLPLPLDPEM